MENTAPWVVDRSRWVRKDDRTYPWDTEPDKLNWTTNAGLPGMIVRNPMGALCGYAAVAAGHPAYGQDYDDVAAVLEVQVHGGLTYAAACAGHICHVPEPGAPDDVWWLGFDCSHALDYTPGLATISHWAYDTTVTDYWDDLEAVRVRGDTRVEVYRDVDYVRAEVERLAAALDGMAAPPVVAGGER